MSESSLQSNLQTQKPRWICHLDLDCFYVSVERLKDPSLVGKPVVVGTKSTRSVISSASYEARKYGVRSAMPSYEAIQRCPQLIFCKPDFESYTKYSQIVFNQLSELVPVVEKVSIDEAYFDLSGCEKIYRGRIETAEFIRKKIKDITGLTASIGIGTSRMISKIASDMAKPDGVFQVEPGNEKEFMKALPIGKIPGIGRKTSELLSRIGVYSCSDLLVGASNKIQKDKITSILGNQTNIFLLKAQGQDHSELSTKESSKSIGAETTFAKDINDHESLKLVLLDLCEEVAYSLRMESYVARTIQIKLRDCDFHTITRSKTIQDPTDLTKKIQEIAIELLKTNYLSRPTRLIGVSLKEIETKQNVETQMTFFADDQSAEDKGEKVDKAKDALRQRFGFDVFLKNKVFK